MSVSAGRCAVCAAEVTGTRRARYCSAKCRQQAYRDRARSARVSRPADSFVGRGAELAVIARMLREHRLVTLVGPAGSGKTRLATEVAARAKRETWFVDLAEISDGDLVPAVIARTLGVRLPLTGTLASRDLVLLLDNCEHLVDACASIVDELVRDCPAVTVLATSREALRARGEQQFPVAEIALPDAVRLFTDRSRVVDPGFQPDEWAEELCERLDRLPLAIELAARWVRLLPVSGIVTRLDDRLGLLTTGHRTASSRHRSLQAAISWSYDLLSAGERAAFRCLAVLTGPFTLEMAAAVCGESEDHALHLLAALAAKSLLQTEPGRYRMLESIRAYGQEQLPEEAGERLVAWVYGKLAPHAGRFTAPPDVLRMLDAHWQCVLVALGRADESRRGLIAVALTASWVARGNLPEAVRVLESAPPEPVVLLELSVLRAALGDHEAAFALADAVDADTPGLRARALHARATALRYLGRVSESRADNARALELLRALDEPLALATVLNNVAWAEVEWEAFDTAAALLDEGLAVMRPLGAPVKLAVMLHTAGTLALQRDDLDRADELFRESLETNTDSAHQVPHSLEGLALVAARRGSAQWAARLTATAAAIRDRAGYVYEPEWQAKLDAAVDPALVASARPVPLADATAFALAGPPPERADDRALSPQEFGIVALVADGLTNQQVARRQGISAATVATHLRRARDKLGVRSRAQLAAWYVSR